jgi:hypothetical protein
MGEALEGRNVRALNVTDIGDEVPRQRERAGGGALCDQRACNKKLIAAEPGAPCARRLPNFQLQQKKLKTPIQNPSTMRKNFISLSSRKFALRVRRFANHAADRVSSRAAA